MTGLERILEKMQEHDRSNQSRFDELRGILYQHGERLARVETLVQAETRRLTALTEDVQKGTDQDGTIEARVVDLEKDSATKKGWIAGLAAATAAGTSAAANALLDLLR